MKAVSMFNELGFKLYNSSESSLIYKFVTDYDEVNVHFDLELKTYFADWYRWVDNNERAFVPMNERPQNIKHSATYGHWQYDVDYRFDIKLHNAIHQQMRELGWIK